MDKFQQLPITLEATWESRQLPLRELLALQPGSILPLRVPLGQALLVRAGGATIGSGDIEVDLDRRSLRIQQLAEGML